MSDDTLRRVRTCEHPHFVEVYPVGQGFDMAILVRDQRNGEREARLARWCPDCGGLFLLRDVCTTDSNSPAAFVLLEVCEECHAVGHGHCGTLDLGPKGTE